MGATPCKGTSNSNKAISIAILGLDNAGKTTTTRVLEKGPVDSVAPTIGYSQTEITHKNEKIKLIDLGGAKTFREAWRHYYDDAYGFVYVLDSSEEDRLGENRDVLKRLLQEEKVKGKPILILANKQDRAEALDKNTILEDLKIERLVNENQTLCRVELCTAKSMNRNGKGSRMDEAIRHGFDWLIKTVYENYDILHRRVDEDVKKRNESEQKAKRERQERVQKLREERDKEEGAENDKDEDDNTLKNGFVPIGQAVKNAERNISEKPPKDKSTRRSSIDKSKLKTTDENTPIPPKPAPRSSSQSRKLFNDESSDEREHPRRHSTELSPRRKESPASRSISSNFDETEQNTSIDGQTSIRSIPGKKKKVIGAGRHRIHGDSLPPLAPSSSASRRDDFPQNKGPPAGTPRPQPLVAQWAITSPTPQFPAEKLTTISSDNEQDDNEQKYKSTKATKRTVSPHPVTNNRITHERKNQLTPINNTDKNEDLVNTDYKKSTLRKRTTHLNDDDDGDDSASRGSLSAPKPRSRISNDSDEENKNRQKTNSRDQDRNSKQYSNKHNDNDNDDDDFNDHSNRRRPSSTHRTTNGTSSHRSHARTNENIDDDLR